MSQPYRNDREQRQLVGSRRDPRLDASQSLLLECRRPLHSLSAALVGFVVKLASRCEEPPRKLDVGSKLIARRRRSVRVRGSIMRGEVRASRHGFVNGLVVCVFDDDSAQALG